MHYNAVFKTLRPSFLILSPICVFLGLSTSLAVEPSIDTATFILILIGATLAHIAVNTLNEYEDFKSGLDFKTERTDFSGGSGALPNHPEAAQSVLLIGIISLVLTMLVGGYLTIKHSTQIIPIGIIGVVIILTYTKWINRAPWLCLISPGIGFGILMVIGTHVILANGYHETPWLLSLVPFFLINNLLLLNQYPDITADKSIGRKTLPIAYGLLVSNIIYAISGIVAYMLIALHIYNGEISMLSAIALVPIVFFLFALYGALQHTDNIGNHPKFLAANVATATLTPLLLAITMFID